jgi:hypothetical protein
VIRRVDTRAVTPNRTYVIEVNGSLPASLAGELAAFQQHTDHETTTLTGQVADTAALYGLVARFEMFGVALISIRPLPDLSEVN